MAIVGFNFTKILAEKNSGIKGKVDIKNNISVKNVESSRACTRETRRKKQ